MNKQEVTKVYDSLSDLLDFRLGNLTDELHNHHSNEDDNSVSSYFMFSYEFKKIRETIDVIEIVVNQSLEK